MRLVPQKKGLRLALLGLAAAGSLLAAVLFLLLALGPGNESGPATPRAADDPSRTARKGEIETRIAAAPEISGFFEKLKQLFPADYALFLEKAAADPSDTPDRWLSDALKTVRQSRGALAARAEAAPLSEIFARQAKLIEALRAADARLCVDFLYGGASEEFFQFAASHRDLVRDLAVANLDAIADGQARKIERGAATDEDFQLLESALGARGLDPAEITALLDGKSPDPPIPDARLCEMGRIYLEALANLPEPTRLRLYALAAELMARS